MNRRTFLCGLTLGTLSAPLVAEAQQPGKVYRIGYISFAQPTTPLGERRQQQFLQELRRYGFVEGQNLLIERRFSQGQEDRHAAFAAELVHMKVDLIVAVGTTAARAAKEATSTIPIVVNVGNAERTGLIHSLARPGGNLTGVSSQIGGETAGKNFQLLKEALPELSRVAVLWNPDNPASAMTYREGEVPAARVLSLDLIAREIRGPADLEPALAAVARDRAQWLTAHTVLSPYRARILEFAAIHRLPVYVSDGAWAQAGALMGYAPDFDDVERHVATYVGKILKGAKPADLPVEQPTKFELVINLKTAKALGLTIPQSLLLRADEVIQ
jgi:putative ABC transport system substrate-binding protein